MSFRVVPTRAISRRWGPLFAEQGLSIGIPERDPSRAELLRAAGEADGILSFLTDRIDAELLAAAPRLRIVANVAVGYDNVDLAGAARRGVLVTNTPGALTEAVADFTWALILAAARRVAEGDRLVREGRFEGWRFELLQGMELAGRSIGIVGYGRIGRAVARRAAGFGMKVLASARRPIDPGAEPGVEPATLEAILARCDVVTLHVPLTPGTRRLIGAPELSRMRPETILVNMARGPVVDEAALATALGAGRIAAAALDVYEEEPKVHPALLSLPNVVLAPHLGSATREARSRMMRLAIGSLASAARGERPLNLVGEA